MKNIEMVSKKADEIQIAIDNLEADLPETPDDDKVNALKTRIEELLTLTKKWQTELKKEKDEIGDLRKSLESRKTRAEALLDFFKRLLKNKDDQVPSIQPTLKKK